MNTRTFLVRGLLAGLIAGVFAFVIGFTVGEPPIDSAIGIEAATSAATDGHSHAEPNEVAAAPDGAHSHGEEDSEGTEVSRSTQKTWGLATATVAVGVALGGILSLISAAVAGRLGRLRVVASTAVVTALGFVAYALVPFLKYPAAPPAVGSGDTIGERTAYFFTFVVVSVLAMVV